MYTIREEGGESIIRLSRGLVLRLHDCATALPEFFEQHMFLQQRYFDTTCAWRSVRGKGGEEVAHPVGAWFAALSFARLRWGMETTMRLSPTFEVGLL